MINIVFSRNCVYQTAYHVVWCPKYRKNIITNVLASYLDKLIDSICNEYGLVVITKEIQPDHIHIFVSIPPSMSVANAVKLMKGITARKIFMDFPNLKKSLWGGALWSPSYYVGTAGNVSAETIKKYIERVEHIKGRR